MFEQERLDLEKRLVELEAENRNLQLQLSGKNTARYLDMLKEDYLPFFEAWLNSDYQLLDKSSELEQQQAKERRAKELLDEQEQLDFIKKDMLWHAREMQDRVASHDWPLTIVSTRYSGAYEGGDFVSFPMEAGLLDTTNWTAGDSPCSNFWAWVDEEKLPVGRGATPQAAYADMLARMLAVPR